MVSLYTPDETAAAEIDKKANEMATARDQKWQEFIDEAFEKELLNHPEEVREKLREALKVPDAERSEEQKALFTKYPSAHITRGNLYQYNQKAADEITKLTNEITAFQSTKPYHDYLSILSEVPGEIPPLAFSTA
ncbi:MAG: hypothetical protein R3C11_09025 [Planctomycetaceae bacterium]